MTTDDGMKAWHNKEWLTERIMILMTMPNEPTSIKCGELAAILTELLDNVHDSGDGRASALAVDWLDESERIAKLGDKSGAFVMRSCALQLQKAILAEKGEV